MLGRSDKKILLVVSFFLFLLVVTGSITLAWLTGRGEIPCDLVSGSVLTQYFHCGTGTEEDPFVITRPVHYYNLVYLYQRKEGFAEQDYYFQLGYDLDGDQDGTLENGEEFLFYEYGDDGKLVYETVNGEQVPKTTKVLNMEYYSNGSGKGGALLPIGTSVTPFIGTFEGNYLTVRNLHIASFQEINGEKYETCDVGVFGYVNGDASVSNVYYDEVTLDLTGANPEAECHGNASVHDTVPDSDSKQDMVFVGYLAGHIKTTSMMDNVYINHCTIIGGTKSDSEFGYFGVLEDPSTSTPVPSLGERIATLRTSGNEAGFGGSIDMKKLFTRIQNVLTSATYENITRHTGYPTDETIVEPSDEYLKPDVSVDDSETIGQVGGNTIYDAYNTSLSSGHYIGSRTSEFTYLYGLTNAQTTSVTNYTQTGELVDAWLLSYDSHYLCVEGTTLVNRDTSAEHAKKWLKDANNHWYTYINNTVYYLDANGTSGIKLDRGIQAQNATVWNYVENGFFSTVIGGRTYYLIYNGGEWQLTPFTESFRITDGKGHYLTGTVNTVSNTNDPDASLKWQVQQSGSYSTISTILNGNVYYLSFNDGLAMSQTEAQWVKDGNGYYISVGGEQLYLLYEDGWKAQLIHGVKIYNGSHFLTASSESVRDTNEANSINWLLSSDSGDTTISTIVGTRRYYLAYDGNFGLTVSTSPVQWHRDGTNSFYITENGTDYYIQYYGGWSALPKQYFTIGDGNGNYMQATAAHTFANTTDPALATRFYFSDSDATPSGTIRYIINNRVYTLGNTNTSFSDANTTWVNDGEGHLYANGTTDYISFEGDRWHMQSFPYKYIISDGNGHYLNASGNTLSVGNSGAGATQWVFSNSSDPSNPSGTLRPDGSNIYIRMNRTNTGSGCNPTYSYSLDFSNTNSNNTWTISNGRLRNNSYTDYYLTLSGNSWSVGTSGTTFTLESSRNLDGAVIQVAQVTGSSPTVGLSDQSREVPAVQINGPISESLTMECEATKEQMYASENMTVRRSCYIPLRVRSDDDDYESDNDPYGVSEKNTGYIIGGTYSEASSSGRGDIRVSRYELSNINGSYSNRAFKTLYTFAGTGEPIAITSENEDNFTQLTAVKEKFLKTLQQDSSYVYGLHFMNTAISTSHIIQAETATIMGKTYLNYDLPESSIDFHVIERGYITFMAGDYYSGNNAFFSLHQIFRNDDEDHTISAIKEIKKVYKKIGDEFASYVYQYADGSYSGTYKASEYELRFDTDWITNPMQGTSAINKKYIYYFEIPCNAGEYALGSVSGRTGGYLLYLDIGTNGGSVVDSIVSGENNSDMERLNVDFRTSPDTIDYSILQFSVNLPKAAQSSDFSVNVVFDNTDHGSGSVSCQNGCYHITVVNKTGEDAVLQVMLCDDDDDPKNSFEYSYKITYTNQTEAEQTLYREVGSSQYEYWKVVAGFVIPSSGKASEQPGYQNS